MLLEKRCIGGCGNNIYEGLSARRKDSLFDTAVMHVCVFLPTHATIHTTIRNKKHHVKRIIILINDNIVFVVATFT